MYCGRVMVRSVDLLNTFLYRFLILTNIFFPGNTEMPDAMDVVFQTALEYGKSGAVSITMRGSLMVSVETSSSLLCLCTLWMLPLFSHI